MTAERAFRAHLAARVRALREARGWRQADVARRAGDAGLGWGRSAVTALERGDRAVSAFEWLALPAVYATTAENLLAGWGGASTVARVSETDRRVASRLGVVPQQVVDAALELWGRSLADERDARSPNARGARGHVTRALTADLHRHLTNNPQEPAT